MTKGALFHFSGVLKPEEESLLAEPARWRWISTLDHGSVDAVEHPRHERWIRVPGNTHAPAIREVMLTFRGTAVHELDGRIYQRSPGTVMLFNHYESRDLKGAAHKRRFHTLWLHFHSRHGLTCNSNSCDSQGRYFQEIPTRVMEGPQITTVMDAWDQCTRKESSLLCWELLKAQLTVLLLEALGRSSEVSVEEPQRQVVEAVKGYIVTHLADPLPLHLLAQIAGYSPFFFHRLFVRYTGETPVEYVNGVRLKRAKELLLAGYTTEATAESVGYASASYFSNLFRRQMGQPPRRWAELRRASATPGAAVKSALESRGPSADEAVPHPR